MVLHSGRGLSAAHPAADSAGPLALSSGQEPFPSPARGPHGQQFRDPGLLWRRGAHLIRGDVSAASGCDLSHSSNAVLYRLSLGRYLRLAPCCAAPCKVGFPDTDASPTSGTRFESVALTQSVHAAQPFEPRDPAANQGAAVARGA